MTESKRGVLALLVACTVWGLSPLYYKLLAHIPPLEVLAHRTLWSCAFFALVLAGQGRLGQLRGVFRSWRVVGVIVFAAVMISVNWFVFILSISSSISVCVYTCTHANGAFSGLVHLIASPWAENQ